MQHQILRFNEVYKMCGGLSRSTVDRLEKAGGFPQRVLLGSKSVGWRLTDILAWLQSRGGRADQRQAHQLSTEG